MINKQKILLILGICIIGAPICAAPSNAQKYFVKPKEKTQSEETTQPQSALEKMKSKKKAPFVVQKKTRTTAPVKKQNQISSRWERNTKQEEPSVNVEEFWHTNFGTCTEEDLALKNLYEAAMQEIQKQNNDFVTKSQEEGTYDALQDLDFQKMRKEYEKTGKFPKELKEIVKNQPQDALNIISLVLKNTDASALVVANTRCIDMDYLKENSDIQEMLDGYANITKD